MAMVHHGTCTCKMFLELLEFLIIYLVYLQ